MDHNDYFSRAQNHDTADAPRYNTQIHSFLGVNCCCLVAKQYIYIAAKNQDPFFKREMDEKKIPDLICLSTLCLLCVCRCDL